MRQAIADEPIIELHEQFEEFDTQQKSPIEVRSSRCEVASRVQTCGGVGS